ncbi:SDR family NAD(P)-dependent oxidoreductase [Neolewinella sp.]|uniref:SDR family NAD(P)-dependent oxidoreductase n=1 Tax=Neolewinella sp. TaxID=2993543 RepID=UPI003B529007
MSAFALTYSAEDQSVARQIAASVGGGAVPVHIPIGRDNEGPLLTDQLGAVGGPAVLLLTTAFLTNPNCLLGLEDVLTGHKAYFGVQEGVDLSSRRDRLRFVSHWQDRYIDLRRGLDTYGESEQLAFDRYLQKIRETSIAVPSLLDRLGQLPSARWAEPTAGATAELEVFLTSSAPAAPAPAPPKNEERVDELRSDEAMEEAWEYYDRGEERTALGMLQQAAERLPEEIELRYQYALMLALIDRTGGGQAAREVLDEVLDDDPYHPGALLLSGELYTAGGANERARNDYERVYEFAPDTPGLREKLGVLVAEHFAAQKVTARQYLEEAEARGELSAAGLYAYAQLLEARGENARAEEMLFSCLAQDAAYAPAYYQLAVLSYRTGRRTEAREHFERAARLEPAFATPANEAAFGEPAVQVASEAPKRAEPAGGQSEKIILISGATSGIGKATARRLAEDGYRLILLGRRAELLDALHDELRQAHGTLSHRVKLDVRDREAVGKLLHQLPEEWKLVDVLINNAGKAKGFDPIQEGQLDHWDEMIDVNLRGLLYLTRAVTPGMVERGRGMVLNVASTAGKEVYPNGNVYCATKHAVDALTYAMRLDLVKHGIRVGQICPAHVEETEFAVVRFDGDRERARIYEDFQPLRASDVAEAIAFMVNQPPHVNVLDMVLQGTQQASSTVVDRSGRERFAPRD